MLLFFMARDSLSLKQARLIALAAHGLDRLRRVKNPKPKHIADTIRSLGLLQLDFANVLVPAHYLVLFSRLGKYDRATFHNAVYRSGEFTEQWAHEACIIPIEAWPLLRHRMESFRIRPYGFDNYILENPAYAERVLAELHTRGGMTADALPPPETGENRLPGTWVGTVSRAVLEAHFARGRVAVTNRMPNFARVYDLAHRAIPDRHREKNIPAEQACIELMRTAARACGIATAKDLADYFRMRMRQAAPSIQALIDAGTLLPVKVEGWREQAYMDSQARIPSAASASAVLSPFDPLVWFRPRALRLFHFDYRIEIYTPPDKRKWGYYVLPFLHGDSIVARIDLKAERKEKCLMIVAAYLEAHASAEPVAEALAKELRELAAWLDLQDVVVNKKGNLATALKRAMK